MKKTFCLATLAAYAGAAIAQANPMTTGYTAWRLGLAAFIVPFMFIYGPPIIMVGPVDEIILAAVTSLIGVAFLAASIQSFALTGFGWVERAALFAAAVLLIKPGWITDVIGIVMGIIIGLIHISKYRKECALGKTNEVIVPPLGL